MTIHVAFVLTPGFALTSFSLSVEALSVANLISGKELYSWRLYSPDPDHTAGTIYSSNHIPVSVDTCISMQMEADYLVICAYQNAATYQNAYLDRILKQHLARKKKVVSLSSGSFILAKAGLLKGQTCTLTSEQQSIFEELYPYIPVQENLYSVSDYIYTCKGGTTALDLLLYLIGVDFGTELTKQISLQFQADRIRSAEEVNKSQKYLSWRIKNPALGAAIEIMENNIEEPYSIESIAQMIGSSTRKLELLFQKYVNSTPKRYYLAMRLKHARLLIENSDMLLSDISNATGFSSHSHMAKCFKDYFGFHPSSIRQ